METHISGRAEGAIGVGEDGGVSIGGGGIGGLSLGKASQKCKLWSDALELT